MKPKVQQNIKEVVYQVRRGLSWLLDPRRVGLGLAGSVVLFFLLHLLFPLPTEKTWSQVVIAEEDVLLNAYLTDDDKWRMRTRIDEVSPDLVAALIAKEDRWFYIHPGINPFAIGRAVFSNIFSGKRVSGASTITMQLARMMEPKRRTYGNKIIEMFRALQLELTYSKEEILELYMSYLPYGGNIEGIKAASLIYFDRPPAKLSLSQSILLTVIPNRPNSLRLDRNQAAAREARDKWIRKFRADGVFPDKDLEIALDEPVNTKRHAITPKAPHFCRYVRDFHARGSDVIETTLDLEVQGTAERLLSNYITRLKNRGVTNGSVLVLDNANGAVVAYCGSADFYDDEAAGQCNGITSVRSPGSTLKPSLYALAFDKGMLTPQSKLLDIPTNFGGYTPENYDLTFHGDVSVEYALMNSLNVPAVRVLEQVGVQDYVYLMERADFRTIKSQKLNLGLSVILGGCGTTLEELTVLFSAFAREGWQHPPAYTRGQLEHESDSVPLFSASAAWMIAEILSGIERPDIPREYLLASSRPRVAWKTGTSYGRRDAWSIGFTPRYTIGVWIGNFDGSGVPDLSGTEMAVPLLFELFDAIDADPEKQWFPEPADLYRRRVCAETGHLLNTHCKHPVTDFYIKNVSFETTCSLDQEVYTSPDTAMQYCTDCLPVEGFIKCTYPLYEPALALWYDENQVPYHRPPPHNPACESVRNSGGPVIKSPSSDFEYLVEAGAGQEILLQATSDTRVNRHYWFIDRNFYQSGKPGDRLFVELKNGRHRISCMDDQGRESKLEITVLEY